MLRKANQTSFKKGNTPHNKGKYGIKKRNFFAGLPNYCEKHGEHLDWIYYEQNRMCACRLCRNERSSKYQSLPENKLKTILKDAKTHAKQRNREFNITLQDLEHLKTTQENRCAISGVSFEDFGNKSVSLDRIDSDKGYTKDNIQLVTKMVNIMKSNFELNEFIDTCKLISKNVFLRGDEKNIRTIKKYEKQFG